MEGGEARDKAEGRRKRRRRIFTQASVKVYLATGVERKSRIIQFATRGGERGAYPRTLRCPYHFLCPPSGHRVLVTVVHAALLFHYLLIHFAIRQREHALTWPTRAHPSSGIDRSSSRSPVFPFPSLIFLFFLSLRRKEEEVLEGSLHNFLLIISRK